MPFGGCRRGGLAYRVVEHRKGEIRHALDVRHLREFIWCVAKFSQGVAFADAGISEMSGSEALRSGA